MDSLPGKFILSVLVWSHLPAGAGGGTLSHRKTMAKARHPREHLPCDIGHGSCAARWTASASRPT